MSPWPLTLRGTGAIALAVVFFFLAHALRITEMLYVSVLLVTAVLASLASLYLVRRTADVARLFEPDVASVGSDATVRVRVDLRSPLPTAPGRWSDRLDGGLHGTAAGAFPAAPSTLGAGARRVELDYRLRADRRGVRTVGPLTVTTSDPFGFARRRQTVGTTAALTVAPAIAPLGTLDELPGAAGGSMHAESNELGQGSDDLIPRAYLPGDSMRRIHWRASAHRGGLMVRQEEQESTPQAVVVLDRTTSRYGAGASLRPGEDEGFEVAVSACASVVARLVVDGYVVSVVDVDGADLVERIDGGDRAGVEALSLALATLTSRRGGSLADLPRLSAGGFTGPLVLVTGSCEEADVDTLAPLAHRSSMPVLLATAPRGHALRELADAGWRVASIEAGRDLPDAWRTALESGRGRA